MAAGSAPKGVLVAAAVTLAAALACIAMLAGGTGRPGRAELVSFLDFRQKCLAACHYDKAHDVHGRLAVMAKCEPGELSRYGWEGGVAAAAALTCSFTNSHSHLACYPTAPHPVARLVVFCGQALHSVQERLHHQQT